MWLTLLGGEKKWPGRVFITRWRWWLEGTKGWKKKGWVWEESTSVRPPHLSPPCVCPEASCVWLVLLRAPAPRFSIQKRTKNARHSSTVGSDVARIPSSEVAVIITGKIVSQSVSLFLLRLFPTQKFCLFHLTTHSAWYQHSKRCHGYDKYQRRRNRKKLV